MKSPLTTRSVIHVCVLASAGQFLFNSTSLGQCTSHWVPSVNAQAPNGDVRAIAEWDPDGAGPQPSQILVGGDFTQIGGIAANHIAAFQPATGIWSPLGPPGGGVEFPVYAIQPMANGKVVAGGSGSSDTNYPMGSIASWDGIEWSAMDGGLSGSVFALTTLPNGHLIAGGAFFSGSGQILRNIAEFDGNVWIPIASGANADIRALATLANGDVIAGGTFTTIGGDPANHIARWNGFFWSGLGAGVNNRVWAIAAPSEGPLSGSVFVAGNLTTAGSTNANFIARWDGSDWFPLGSGMEYQVFALTSLPPRLGGGLIAAGNFNFAGGENRTGGVALWNGTRWAGLGDGLSSAVQAVTVASRGEVLAGGSFDTSQWGGSPGQRRFARFVVAGSCIADFDCSGGPADVQDLFAFLHAWFAGDQGADINSSGGITVQDVFDFLAGWWAGC